MSAVKVLKAQIKDELAKLQKLLEEASQLAGERQSSIHVRAGSSILHDFYTGLENVFHAIASTIDGKVPKDPGRIFEVQASLQKALWL